MLLYWWAFRNYWTLGYHRPFRNYRSVRSVRYVRSNRDDRRHRPNRSNWSNGADGSNWANRFDRPGGSNWTKYTAHGNHNHLNLRATHLALRILKNFPTTIQTPHLRVMHHCHCGHRACYCYFPTLYYGCHYHYRYGCNFWWYPPCYW
jgi:hypothetical protein